MKLISLSIQRNIYKFENEGRLPDQVYGSVTYEGPNGKVVINLTDRAMIALNNILSTQLDHELKVLSYDAQQALKAPLNTVLEHVPAAIGEEL